MFDQTAAIERAMLFSPSRETFSAFPVTEP
jgi:hypothetical protein